jgi:hypothetical protein
MQERGIHMGKKQQQSWGFSLNAKVHQKRPRKKSVNNDGG